MCIHPRVPLGRCLCSASLGPGSICTLGQERDCNGTPEPWQEGWQSQAQPVDPSGVVMAMLGMKLCLPRSIPAQ